MPSCTSSGEDRLIAAADDPAALAALAEELGERVDARDDEIESLLQQVAERDATIQRLESQLRGRRDDS